MFSCKKAAVLMSKGQDNSLSLGERFSLQCHLAICHSCRLIRRQLPFLSNAAGQLNEDEEMLEAFSLGQELSSDARDRIRSRLQSENNDTPL